MNFINLFYRDGKDNIPKFVQNTDRGKNNIEKVGCNDFIPATGIKNLLVPRPLSSSYTS